MRYVIIGNGIAGTTAAQVLRQHDTEADITLLTNEFHPLGLYARHQMARRFVNGLAEPEAFQLIGVEELAAQNIKLIYEPVERIYPARSQILRNHAMRQVYDKLLLATGALPQLVDAPGLHLQGVHQLRNWEDISLIEAWMSELKQSGAVVIGGGVLGLDIAHALNQRGVPTTLVVRESHVAASLLSAEGARLIEDRLLADGITLITNVTVTEYASEDNKVLDGVCLSDGRVLPARMALSCIGVLPNAELVEDMIETDAATGGIFVNSQMQTSHADVYAAGNCASLNGMVTRNWKGAEAQGRVAALNMLGIEAHYDPANAADLDTHLYTLPMACLGQTLLSDDVQVQTWGETDGFGQVLVRDDKIVGGLLLGSVVAQGEALLAAYRTGESLSQWLTVHRDRQAQ